MYAEFVPKTVKITPVSGERALIAAIRSRSQTHHSTLRLGIGDDCAILRPPKNWEIVVTTDFSLEQVHFRRDWHSPEAAGHRCLARGLSDLAAMGAKPEAAFLSIALPAELTISKGQPSWMERFLDGLLTLAGQKKVPLAGGDTSQAPSFDKSGSKQAGMVSADIILLGSVPQGRALLRSGARAGDTIYVTGALGGAAAELLAVGRNPKASLKLKKMAPDHPHLFPEPRLSVGARLLATKAATAAIDISDGLSVDLAHLCEESGLQAEIDAAAIPLHSLAQKAGADGSVPSALHLALHGGEDYELLFTASKSTKIPRKIAGVPIHAIGQMKHRRKGHPLIAMQKDGKAETLRASGWEHFK